MSFTAWGDEHPNWIGDAASYSAVHARLKSWLGPAKDHDCVKCGRRAANWAYDHSDPQEKTSPNGLKYSTTAKHYKPMCISCHRYSDADAKGQAKCGTYAGYFRHRRRGEQPCPNCRRACRDHERRRVANRRNVLTEYQEPA